MDNRIAQWIVSRDTGRSSMAIVARMNGAAVDPSHYPLDPADLGRCIRLLSLMPEYRERLGEMSTVSKAWAQLVQHWDELETLYFEELPQGRAPKCYDRMKELFDIAYPGYGKRTITID